MANRLYMSDVRGVARPLVHALCTEFVYRYTGKLPLDKPVLIICVSEEFMQTEHTAKRINEIVQDGLYGWLPLDDCYWAE